MTLARIAVALALAIPFAAHAGLVIEGKDGEKTQRILLEGKKMRMDGGPTEDGMIFDGATNRSIQLNPEEKTYVEFTKEDVAKMNAMVTQGGQKKGEKVWSMKYEKTGKTDTVLGKTCDIYRVIQSNEPEEQDEMCLAPFGTFGVDKSDFEAFRAFGDFMSQMGGGEFDKSWTDIPGVPLLSWEMEDGQRKEEFRATKVEKRSIPASEFAVPAGWKKGPGFAEQMKQMEEMQKQMEGKQGAPPKKK